VVVVGGGMVDEYGGSSWSGARYKSWRGGR